MSQKYNIGKIKVSSSRVDLIEAHGEDNRDYFIETMHGISADFEDLVNLKNDYEITVNRDIEHSLKSFELIRFQGGVGVVKELFGDIFLEQLLENGPISLDLFFNYAIKLAECISDIHSAGIVHKDICPANILLNSKLNELKITNFGLASTLAVESLGIDIIEEFRGSVLHMSPEQTGRMNRSIDYRTDFYSLGATYYEMLMAKPPFQGDLVEIVHAHLAKMPVEITLENKELAADINLLVMKLMAKNAEDRYLSADGLKNDLVILQEKWKNPEIKTKFIPGQKDFSHVLSISEKLYGRQEEREKLLTAFDHTFKSSVHLVAVSGYSAIPKTALINEVHKAIAEKRGNFIAGKFDQYNRDIPYSAIGQAFGDPVRMFLAQPPEVVEYWRSRIQRAVKDNGAVLTEIIPELELIIGKQEPVLRLGATESKARFLQVFHEFIKVIAAPNHPLVLFIDDLQWADSGSLLLLQSLMASTEIKHFLIISAHRDNEVNILHPMVLMLEKLKKEVPDRVQEIKLKELEEKEVNQLIADSLQQKPDATKELSDIIISKTQGNPFFIKQFIQKLAADSLLSYDKDKLCWTWDVTKVSNLKVTENVVDLIENKIRLLSADLQEILAIAGCIGNRFDLRLLVDSTGYSEHDAAHKLAVLVGENLITPVGKWNQHYGDDFWKEIGIEIKSKDSVIFQFLHDRIQQAAYALLPTTEKRLIHLKLGRLMLSESEETIKTERLFDILNQFSLAGEEVTDTAEKEKLAALNLLAGDKAKNANSYQPALNNYRSGMLYLENNTDSTLYRDLLVANSETEYLCGNYEESEKLFDMAIANAASNIEKAGVYASKMQLYENTQRHAEAIDVASKGLALLGTKLPVNVGTLGVMTELLKVKMKLRGKTTAQILEYQEMHDARIKVTMKILMNLWGPAYLLQKQNLLVWFILRMVNLSIKYGNSIESALAYAFYGYVTAAQLKDFKSGYDFSRLGINLNEKLNDETLKSKVIVIADGCVAHWKEPYLNILESLENAYKAGVESNDLIYAGYAVTFNSRNSFIGGEPLLDYISKLKGFIHFAHSTHSPVSLHQLLAWYRVALKLAGVEAGANEFKDLVLEHDQVAFIQDFAVNGKVPLPLCNYLIMNGMYSYLQGDYKTALQQYESAIPLLPAVLGLPEVIYQTLFHALSITAILKEEGSSNTSKMRKTLSELHKTLKKWAESSQENFAAKYELLNAEIAAVDNDFERAESLYSIASQTAIKNGQTQISAIAYERRSELLIKFGKIEESNAMLRESWLEYTKWGAAQKVELMEKENPILLGNNSPVASEVVGRGAGYVSSSQVDLQSIIKASTSISGEVVYDKLLQTLMRIVIENAGAQNGFVIVPKDSELFVEVSGKTGVEISCNTINKSLSEINDIAQTIVLLVHNTLKPVILDNAITDVRFVNDKHISKNKPLSVLCIPILQHGRCSAIIYLENNITTGAFTADRLNILNLLSGQIAISIENALLIENLEEKVRERTSTIESQKEELSLEKDRSDALLLNILPHEIAEELKLQGRSKPRKHESVSIMFTDFEGFTKLSEELEAEELVAMIDDCYREFDRITAKYNIEKIKTIGDSYMCVCGIPAAEPHHAENIVRAALEVVHFIDNFNKERIQKGLAISQIRVGIHTGPVIAGVVGSKKFAYDIWGDAVNIASRAESAGQVGMVNITAITYALIKDKFECTHRGKIAIKNKADIDMYFVERELPSSAAQS